MNFHLLVAFAWKPVHKVLFCAFYVLKSNLYFCQNQVLFEETVGAFLVDFASW